MKWLLRGAIVLVAGYLILFGGVAVAMHQPPERFGLFMKYMPGLLVWRALPAPRMWQWARAGHLLEGQQAPDFTLAAHDRSGRITLSSYRGQRPVVLIFGSYT